MRRYLLENSNNTRDLGGYSISLGKYTKFEKFIRSDIIESINENELEFLKKINISAFNGITEKIDEALNKKENVIFNVLLSDKTSINSYENRFGFSYFLFLEDNMLGKTIYNYLLNGVFEKDLTTSKIKFDNSKNLCRIDENNLKVIINSKTLVNELYETGLLEQEYEKEKNMKRQLKWEE